MWIYIVIRFLQFCVFCTVSLVKQVSRWFILFPPDQKMKDWLIMPNYVNICPGSSSATKVIWIPRLPENKPEETPNTSSSPRKQKRWPMANKSYQEFPLAAGQIRVHTCPSHLKQSSKARKHTKSCQWFPLAAGQI